jgi:hypothetical protein
MDRMFFCFFFVQINMNLANLFFSAVLYGGVEVRDDGTHFLAEKDKPVQVYSHSCRVNNTLFVDLIY